MVSLEKQLDNMKHHAKVKSETIWMQEVSEEEMGTHFAIKS